MEEIASIPKPIWFLYGARNKYADPMADLQPTFDYWKGPDGKQYYDKVDWARSYVRKKTGIKSVDDKWIEELRTLKEIRILENLTKYLNKKFLTPKQGTKILKMLDKIHK